MGSGFLLAIVLCLWGMVLYPTIASKRVNSNESKSIARFNQTLKSISDLTPTKERVLIDNKIKAARRRRNVTYILFTLNIGVIISSYLNYVPQFVTFVPLGILLTWFLVAFVAAQSQLQNKEVVMKKKPIPKNYIIYKNPSEKTYLKTDPERDLIMDERPIERIEEERPKPKVVEFEEETKRAQGA